VELQDQVCDRMAELERLDVDDDGLLSSTEYSGTRALFDDLDVDADGLLDEDEARFMMTFVDIPAGRVTLGTDDPIQAFGEAPLDQGPAHKVHIDAFQMAATEITEAQYAMYLNSALADGEITVSLGDISDEYHTRITHPVPAQPSIDYTEHMFNSAPWNPPDPFSDRAVEYEVDDAVERLVVIEDDSREILSRNRADRVPFTWSVNPYRGCSHACAYCYARRFHELLGLGAGSDFERVLTVKPDAARLLDAALRRRPELRSERVHFSGATDCYQPLEHSWKLTQACLEVCARHRQPVSLVTRAALVARDAGLLATMDAWVVFSIPLGDRTECRALEPGAPSPAARLAAMATLARAGVPVGVSISPIIPGLSEPHMARTLQAAAAAGARWAGADLVALQGPVAAVFERRLRGALPDQADTVLARIRRAWGGELELPRRYRPHHDDPAWRATLRMFELQRCRAGLGAEPPPVGPVSSPQLGLFEGECSVGQRPAPPRL